MFKIFSYSWPFLLTSLFNLYNLLENPYSRFFVYMKALNLALNGKVTDHIIPSFKKIDSFIKEWNIDIKDKRELFLGIANVLKENKRHLTECLNACKTVFAYAILYICGYDFIPCNRAVAFLFFQLLQGFFQVSDKVSGNFLRWRCLYHE